VYQIKLAKNEDMESIKKLYNSLIGIQGCSWSTEYPTIVDVQNDIFNNSLYCLCDSTGVIVAVATVEYDCKLNQPLWSGDVINHCELARVGVNPELHNQGLGRLIIENIINDLKKRKFDGIRLLVGKTNYSALSLYKKFNFQCCGEIKMYNIDWYCYELRLV